MKTKLKLFQARLFCAVALGIGSSVSLAAAARDSADPAPAKTTQAERGHSCPQQRIAREVHNKFQLAGASEGAADRNVRAPLTNHAIPWSQIGAKAAADYQGDGLAISPTAEGARLRCVLRVSTAANQFHFLRFLRFFAANLSPAAPIGIQRHAQW